MSGRAGESVIVRYMGEERAATIVVCEHSKRQGGKRRTFYRVKIAGVPGRPAYEDYEIRPLSAAVGEPEEALTNE